MTNETKQTAVEWLVDQVEDFMGLIPTDLINKAKEMEKEQIEEAYKYARGHWSKEDGNAEQYYNETYGGNK